MNKGNLPNVFLFDMENYISRGRRVYLNMIETIKPNVDFVVDGTYK
ncbi:hypothetical protein P5G62_009475 [Neobacillus sp. 179-C4.2 HS]|uniref:Uncharacterized protein n=1 Tax=Neobacillus driksii TaxID=3035913 RepID=A0ABV4YR55_9BACI|nr:hypothetical protein [Neobacillus sp. 179.-C4.2 HS]MDP5194911.1 hypothetical protein [Neobacillus sp. 179.-C4.2 HS]